MVRFSWWKPEPLTSAILWAMRLISSRQNALVTSYRSVSRRQRSNTDNRIFLDGVHLIVEAKTAGLAIQEAAFDADRLKSRDEELLNLATFLKKENTRIVKVTKSVMAAISPVRKPSGVVAIAERPSAILDDLLTNNRAMFLVLIDIQDPGNVGAIIRAADGGGATAVVTIGATAEPYSWKALRASMGSAFRIPVVRHNDIKDLVLRARRAHLDILATTPRHGTSLFSYTFPSKPLILLGNEGAGLPPEIVELVDDTVSVPMQAGVESLNVAVTAGLVVYEAYRQRRMTQ